MKIIHAKYTLIICLIISSILLTASIINSRIVASNIIVNQVTIEKSDRLIVNLESIHTQLEEIDAFVVENNESNTKSVEYLYLKLSKKLLKSIDNFKFFLVKSNISNQDIDIIVKLIDQKTSILNYYLEKHQTSPISLEDKKIFFIKNFELNHEIIKIKDKIIDNERLLIKDIDTKEKTNLRISNFGVNIAGITTLLIGLITAYFINNQIKQEQVIQKELKALNANKDRFFSIISHDLRGPIKNIVMLSQILNDGIKTKSYNHEKIAKMIESSSKSVSNLLDNLLKWSKIQMNKVTYSPETFHLSKLVQEVFDEQAANAEKKSIALISEIPDNHLVFADQNMIQTIIRNLVSNAIKFTRENGEIKLSSKIINKMIEVTVKDSGVGMSATMIEKLTTYNNSDTTKGTLNEEGTGLGLVICKEFININGGSLRVESELNAGTSMIFTIYQSEV